MCVRATPKWAVNAFSAACEARRRDRSPRDTFHDEASTALLVPATGQAPTWMGPMVPPALVRGSRTEVPVPARPEQSVWPHADDKVQSEEVPLFYPGTPKPDQAMTMRSPKAVGDVITDDSSLLYESSGRLPEMTSSLHLRPASQGGSLTGGRRPEKALSLHVRPASHGGQRRRKQSPAQTGRENSHIQTDIPNDICGATENSHPDTVSFISDRQKESASHALRRTASMGRFASRGGPLGPLNSMYEDKLLNLSASAKVLGVSTATLPTSPSKDSFFRVRDGESNVRIIAYAD